MKDTDNGRPGRDFPEPMDFEVFAEEQRASHIKDLSHGDPVRRRVSRFQTAIAVIVPAMLALALVAVCIWASEEKRQAAAREQSLETMVQSGYRQAFYELSDNINDIQSALKKLRVTASSSRHILLLSDVWRLSGAAVANMGNIPSTHVDAAELNSFLVRVGDYSHVLTQRILAGGVLTQEDYDQLDALCEASIQISNGLSERMAADDFPIQSLDADGYYSAADAGGATQGQQSEASISDYPTLIYDGPFSESNEQAAPRGLPDGEISEATAKQAALDYLGGGELTGSGPEDGTIPVYGFYGTDGAGRNVEITVSRQGGAVLWMMCEVASGEDGVPDEHTVSSMRDAAKAYLDAHGYEGMEATYAQFYDGVGVFNFAATQDDIILYNDLVKVYVERANATVCGVDANNYLMMHVARTLPAAQLTREEAAHHVSDALEQASVRLALIPKTAATETLCYEFKGVCRGSEFIVYINAISGAEEEIFEIINSQDGQLVV